MSFKSNDLCRFKTTNGMVKLICPVPDTTDFWVVEWIATEFHECPYAVMKEEWLVPTEFEEWVAISRESK